MQLQHLRNRASGSALRGGLLAFPVAAVLVAALLGVSRLWDPLGGDQALFLLGATALHNGALLYRDIWDLKQPGIYEFYEGAGSAFGFTPLAVHVAELAVWLMLSVAQIFAIRPALRRPALVGIAPLATAGVFYLGATVRDFGQPETLAGAPLFVSVWLFIASLKQQRHAIALAGAAGLVAGLAIIGKLLFAAIALAAIAAILAAGRAGIHWSLRLLAFTSSASIPLIAYLAAGVAHHDFKTIVYTWFVLPPQIIATVANAPLGRLLTDTKIYLKTFALPVGLAVIAPFSELTPQARPWRNAMLAWITASTVVILVQRFSWWDYHFMLLVVPIGVLATLGVDALVERFAQWGQARRQVVALLTFAIALALIATPLVLTVRRIAELGATRAPFSRAGGEAYRDTQSSEYTTASTVAAFVNRQVRPPNGIFIAGDPLVYTLSQTVPDVAINGWGLELLLPTQWQTLTAQLSAARPADIFVAAEFVPLITQQSPAITIWLQRKYHVAARSQFGIWYTAR